MKKTKRAKIFTLLFAVIFLAASCGILTKCRIPEEMLPEYENEYYRYAVREESGKYPKGYIVGFTELGLKQEYLILPNAINDIPIIDFGYERKIGYLPMWGQRYIWYGYHPSIKKLFAPFIPFEGQWKSLLFRDSMGVGNGYLVQWKSLYPDGLRDILQKGEIVFYKAAEEYFAKEINKGERYFEKDKLANLVYKLNYRGAPDGGYYWVDSYDNSVAEFIPPAPTREGYTFAGWYKESACQNAWDFATDKTGDEIIILKDTILEDYDDREVTRLYAKWEQA